MTSTYPTEATRASTTVERFSAFAWVVLLSGFFLGTMVEAAESPGKVVKRPAGSAVTGTSGAGKEVTESSSVFLGPMQKSSVIKITDMVSGRSQQTHTDSDGQYAIEKTMEGTVIHVFARGKVFDLRRGRMGDEELLLSAVSMSRAGDAPPQVNLLSTLVSVRANVLAGMASRGPYARIVMPSVIEQAERQVIDALAVAMVRMRRVDGRLATVKDVRDDGSMGQAQVMHVSLVMSEAAAARGSNGMASLLNDMTREIAILGKLRSSTVLELRAAENQMNAISMLRTLQEEYGFGQACAVHYR
jgi:hypothetical protein